MGNEVTQNDHQVHQLARPSRFFKEGQVNRNNKRGISHQLGGKRIAVRQQKCNVSITSDKTEQSSNKHRKFLSLTKQNNVGMDAVRTESREKKGIRLTSPNEAKLKGGISYIINYQDYSQKRDNINSRPTNVRPRDLPRHSSNKNISTCSTIPLSSLKTIHTGPSHEVLQVQQHNRQQSHIFSHGTDPSIQINYKIADEYRPNGDSFAKFSIYNSTAPSANTSVGNWFNKPASMEESTRKLKKVPLTRSFELNSTPKPVTHENQEQSIFIKEISEMSVLKNNLKDETKHYISKFDSSRSNYIESKQNEPIFTDPKMMGYIKDNNKGKEINRSRCSNKDVKDDTLSRFQEIESKYAVAYPQDGYYLDNLMMNKRLSESFTRESRVNNKYSVAFDKWPSNDQNSQNLEEKVDRQVESKQMIEEPFRFPTATDISYEERSNPSFIPVKPMARKEKVNYIELDDLDDDHLLEYCKPKINSKVLADMLKLPLKA